MLELEANRFATGKRIGDDLQMSPGQQPRHLVGRGAAVQQQRVAVLNELRGAGGDRPLLVPLGRLPLVEMGQLRRRTGIEDPAMSPLGRAGFLEKVEVAAHGRLGNCQRIGQIGQCRKAARPHKFQQARPPFFGKHGQVSESRWKE